MKTYKREFRRLGMAREFSRGKKTLGFNVGAELSETDGFLIFWSVGFLDADSAVEG